MEEDNQKPACLCGSGEYIVLACSGWNNGYFRKTRFKSFWQNALGEGIDFVCPEELYLRGVANIALGDAPGKKVPDDGLTRGFKNLIYDNENL